MGYILGIASNYNTSIVDLLQLELFLFLDILDNVLYQNNEYNKNNNPNSAAPAEFLQAIGKGF